MSLLDAIQKIEKPTFRKLLFNELADVLEMPPPMDLVEWANTYRFLPSNSAESGRFRSERMIVALEPMRCVTDDSIREITLMCPTQMLKTELLLNTAFYYTHHDPSPIIFVLPKVADAKMISVERFTKSMLISPALKAIYDKYSGDGNTILTKNFLNTISFASANNPSDLASRSVRIVLADEVDKYTRSAGTEGDPLLIVGERTEWYSGYEKIIKTCSPTIKGLSRIEEEYHNSDMRVYMHKCPDCGQDYVPDFDINVIIPGYSDGKPKWKKAYMMCHMCEHIYSEGDRLKSIKDGHYHKQNPEVTHHAGFNMSRLSSPFPVVQNMARKRIEAGNDQNKIMVFVNTQKGQSYQMRGMAFGWKALYDKRETYKIGIVPADVIHIICGVDIQEDRIVAEYIGVCKYMEVYSIKTYVELGDIDDEKFRVKIARKLLDPMKDTNNAIRHTKLINIDSNYKTQSVYALVSIMKGKTDVRPVHGKYNGSDIVASPKAVGITIGGKRRKSSVKLWGVNSSLIKETIYGYYQLEAPTQEQKEIGMPYPSGFFHTPEYGDDYYKESTAEIREEQIDKNGNIKYEWVKIRKENHYLDTKVYAYAGTNMLGMDGWNAEKWESEYQSRQGQRQERREKRLTPTIDVTQDNGNLRIRR